MALFGDWADLSTFGGLSDIREFFHVNDELWDAVSTHLGQMDEHIRLVAALRGPVPNSSYSSGAGVANGKKDHGFPCGNPRGELRRLRSVGHFGDYPRREGQREGHNTDYFRSEGKSSKDEQLTGSK